MSDLDDGKDLPELPDAPDLPTPDADLERANAAVAGMDDDQALRKIGRRTSTFGSVVGFLLLASGIGLGGFSYWRHTVNEEQWAAYRRLHNDPSEGGAEDLEDFLRQVRGMLEARPVDNDLRFELMTELEEHRDAEAVPLLTTLIDEPGVIRAHAARALSAIGSPDADAAKPALLRALPSCTAADRVPVVWALAVLNEPAAADAIVTEFANGSLQHMDGFDPRIISRVLGPTRLASETLTHHETAGVRNLVAQALSEIGTPEVVDPLASMLEDEDDNVRRNAAAGLGRIGDPRAAQALFAAVRANASMRVAVNDALRRSTGARGLAVLLAEARDEVERADLATMLRNTHDPAAADALASLLTDTSETIRIEAAHGLAEVGDARAVPVLLDLAASPSLETARDALDQLKIVTAPGAAERLIPLLDGDEWIARRSGVLRALGITGSTDAGRAMMSHLEGDDMSSAGIALAELGYDPAFDTLLRLIPRGRDDDYSRYDGMAGVLLEPQFNVRTAAVRSIGRFGRPDPDAVEALVTVIEDPQDDVRLRSDAGTALGAIADDTVLEMIIGKIQQTDLDEAARRYYLNALWQHPSRALAGRLLDLIENPTTPPDVRRPAAIAVGYTADPANDERLVRLLANEDTVRDGAFAILLGGSEAAATALLQAIVASPDLRDALTQAITNSETPWFNLIRADTWDSGEIYRRLRVARVLDTAAGEQRFGLVWSETITRLQGGWDGHDGLSVRDVRRRLYADLTGEDAGLRSLAAEVLGSMNEIGLLMAARDSGGNGAEEARNRLRTLNNEGGDDEEG